MKHVEISEAIKAKLRHPSDILADEKAKVTAAPAVDRGQSKPPDDRGRSNGRGRGDDKDKGKGKGKGKGRGRSRTPGGTPIDKTGERPKAAAKPKPKPRPHSPVPPRSESLGSQAGGLKTNKEIVKELRLPGFCKDFRAGTCTRDIISRGPICCKNGAHVTDEVYQSMKERQKAAVKAAKEKRNRSQSAPPRA